MANLDLDEILTRTRELLLRAFPEGPTPMEYLAILEIMNPHFSSRNLAKVIEQTYSRSYSEALNDVYRAQSGSEPASSESLASVAERFASSGYEAWLQLIED